MGKGTGTLSTQEKPGETPEREDGPKTYLASVLIVPNLAFSEATIVPFPSPDGATPRTVGTARAVACPCVRMEKFIDSGPGLWGRGNPRTGVMYFHR